MSNQESPVFNRTVIVGVLLAAAFIAILNQTLLLIAIPPIMADFNIDAARAQWLTTAFMLMTGILIPITAFLIEKYSSKKLLITGIAIFTIGTIVGAVAPTFSILLVARIIQAAGAGIIFPLMQTVFLILYPPEKRGAAMGMAGLVTAFAPAIGPTLSGWILVHFSWRYIFYLLIPIAVLVLVLSVILMKNVTKQRSAKIDFSSVVFSSFGWGGLLYGFSMVGSLGWTSGTVILSLAVGAISLTIFILRQFKLEKPMLEFRVFQSPTFTITTILSVFVFSLMIGIQTLLALYTQNVKHLSAFDSGLLLLPGAVVNGILSPIIGKTFDKIGGKGLSIIGFCSMLLSTLLFIGVDMDTSSLYIAGAFILLMIGISMNMMPLMTAGMNALSPALIPHGTAMTNTIRTVGASIGTAILISIMTSVSANSAQGSFENGLLQGIHAAFIVACAMAIIGLVTAFSLKKNERTGQKVVTVSKK